MMKRMQRIAVLAMTVCLILGTMAVSVFAEDYEHKVTVSPGNGTFSEGSSLTGKSITVQDGLTGKVTVGDKTVTVTPPENHFVMGMKEAGLDNSTYKVGKVDVGDKDVEYVIAYGLKSNMVEYTVTYQDLTNGTTLGSETHYGVIGDKPVVSYKYFEGYVPANAYAMTGTLSENASDNVFAFTYNVAEYDEEGNIVNIIINDGGGAAGAGGAGGAAGGAGGAAGGAGGADGANIGDGAVPQAGPADLVDIDNPDTPRAGDTNGDGVIDENDTIEDNKTPGADWSKIGIGAGAAAVVAIAAAILAKRRKEDEE